MRSGTTSTTQNVIFQEIFFSLYSAANGGGDGKITKSGSFDIPPEMLGKEHINPELQPDNVIEQQYKHKPKNFTGAVGNGYGGVEHPSTATTDNAGQDAADNQVALEMEAKQLNSVVVEKQLMDCKCVWVWKLVMLKMNGIRTAIHSQA